MIPIARVERSFTVAAEQYQFIVVCGRVCHERL